MSNNTTHQDTTKLFFEKSSSYKMVLTFVSPTLLMVMSTIGFVLLITYLKKLNRFLKGLLITSAIHQFISSLILIITFGYMFYFQTQDYVMCSILSQALVPNLYTSIDTLALLSFIRFHLAWKTDNNEIVKTYKIVGMVTLVFILEHVLNIFWNAMSFGFSIPYWTLFCADEKNNGIPIAHFFTIGKLVAVACFGIIQDRKLMEFLKKKNSSVGPGQNKLVKWKSSNEQPYTLSVPIGASMTSFGSTFVAVTTLAMVMIWTLDNDQEQMYFLVSLHVPIIGIALHWPFVIGLTLKAAKNKKPPPVIPRRPMFHDDQSDEEDIHEDSHEHPQPSTSRMIHVKPAPTTIDVEHHI